MGKLFEKSPLYLSLFSGKLQIYLCRLMLDCILRYHTPFQTRVFVILSGNHFIKQLFLIERIVSEVENFAKSQVFHLKNTNKY